MNDELLALYNTDREERVDQPCMGTPEYTAMRERDKKRRLRAAAILATLPAQEAADLYHAALLFQHGDEAEDAWRAYELARDAPRRSALQRSFVIEMLIAGTRFTLDQHL